MFEMKEIKSPYFIKHPIFLKTTTHWKLWGLKKLQHLDAVAINEHIIAVPLAVHWVSQLPRETRILDLGCAESVLPLYLAGLGYRVSGCDYRHYPYTHPNFDFVQGDLLQLPFNDDKYDVVICLSTIEHVGKGAYNDPLLTDKADKTAILEIYRVLKKGGTLILSAPFGIEDPNNRLMIYNQESFPRLLQNFLFDEIRYFRHPGTGDFSGKSWREVKREEAATVKSKDRTNCICMVRARK
jgi:SAM-dependent methyltransferase